MFFKTKATHPHLRQTPTLLGWPNALDFIIQKGKEEERKSPHVHLKCELSCRLATNGLETNSIASVAL